MIKIKHIEMGTKVHGSNGYSVIKMENNSPYRKYYVWRSDTLPDGWDESDVVEVGLDDEIDYLNPLERYIIKDDYLSAWGTDSSSPIITKKDIINQAINWDKPVSDLMDQVEPI